MKINNVELEDLDIFDADISEKYENEMVKIRDNIKRIEDEFKESKIKQSEYIRKLCTVVNEFFDSLLGENTAFKVFNGKCNMVTSVKAFAEVVDWVNEGKSYKEQFDDIDKVVNKYSPNRLKRRANAEKSMQVQ